MIDYFKTVIMFMLFYSLGITTYCHFLPSDALHFTTAFSGNSASFEDTASKFQSGLSNQTNLPLLDMGALIFYSGNYLIDLLLNFVFAIPNIITTLLYAIGSLFGINTFIWAYLDLFAKTLMIIYYFMGLIEMILGLRSGQRLN